MVPLLRRRAGHRHGSHGGRNRHRQRRIRDHQPARGRLVPHHRCGQGRQPWRQRHRRHHARRRGQNLHGEGRSGHRPRQDRRGRRVRGQERGRARTTGQDGRPDHHGRRRGHRTDRHLHHRAGHSGRSRRLRLLPVLREGRRIQRPDGQQGFLREDRRHGHAIHLRDRADRRLQRQHHHRTEVRSGRQERPTGHHLHRRGQQRHHRCRRQDFQHGGRVPRRRSVDSAGRIRFLHRRLRLPQVRRRQ